MGRQRVLIVDDEIQMRFYLKTLVTSLGFEPVLAKDGNQGLDALAKGLPCAVILDIMMPEKGGARFYQEFLKYPEYQGIPVIFFSGVDQKAFFHYIKMLNLNDEHHIPAPEYYVAKNADPAYLKDIVKRCVSKER